MILMENHQKRLKNDGIWIVWKNMEIIAITSSWQITKSGVNFGSDDEKAVIGKIRARSLQKQPFHHQQMITDHPNFNLTTDKKYVFSIIFSTFLKSTFLVIFQPFFRKNHPNNSFSIKFWRFHEVWHLKYWMHLIMSYILL